MGKIVASGPIKVELENGKTKDGKSVMQALTEKIIAKAATMEQKLPFAADGFKSSKQPVAPFPFEKVQPTGMQSKPLEIKEEKPVIAKPVEQKTRTVKAKKKK